MTPILQCHWAWEQRHPVRAEMKVDLDFDAALKCVARHIHAHIDKTRECEVQFWRVHAERLQCEKGAVWLGFPVTASSSRASNPRGLGPQT